MQNQDIFKQAIAEAKSVRDAAIANAKESIEESLTPHLKELLAAKLQEMEDSENDLAEVEDSVNEEDYDAERDAKAMGYPSAAAAAADNYGNPKHEVVAEEEGEEEAEDDAEESEDDADNAEGEEEEVEAETEDDEEIDLETLTVDDLRDMIRDIVSQEAVPSAEAEMDMDISMEPAVDDMVGMDEPMADEEEIDLDELLAELEGLSEEEHEEEDTTDEMKKPSMKKEKSYKEMKKKDDHSKMEAQLQEAMDTINHLRNELSEVNLLNSKLLFVNKLFKSKTLSEVQKAHVIATFDKAETVKEAKLVYESFTTSLDKSTSQTTQIKEHKSFASKATGVTKSASASSQTGVITEVSDQVRRMQKLAGIIN